MFVYLSVNKDSSKGTGCFRFLFFFSYTLKLNDTFFPSFALKLSEDRRYCSSLKLCSP